VLPESPTALLPPKLQSLLERYVTFWKQADTPVLVALLRENAWFQGRAVIAMLLSTRIFTPGRQW
jgi:hypothetical protein